MDEKGDRWAFTAWQKPNIKNYKYICWQQEYTPSNGLLHYQGYIEFNKEYTLKYVKSLFKTKNIHLGIATKNREANRNYCFKNQAIGVERFEGGDIDTGRNEGECNEPDNNIIASIFCSDS